MRLLPLWTLDSLRLPKTPLNGSFVSIPASPKRYTRVLGLSILTALILLLLLNYIPGSLYKRNPPLYEKFNEFERHLPQHDLSLPYPDGKHAKFIHFANHQDAAGWGNCLQELFLNAQLALVLKRSYVFDNYTWEHEPHIYSNWNGNLIPSRIPLTTMITGPLVGGSLGPGYEDIPRGVSSEYFKQVCPESLLINTTPISNKLGWPTTTNTIIGAWVEELEKLKNERCIEVQYGTDKIFHIFLFGGPYILDIWPTLKYSPVITHFGHSPLILNAYAANRDIWEPQLGFKQDDFETYCSNRATWLTHYNGQNEVPKLPDQFGPPSDASWTRSDLPTTVDTLSDNNRTARTPLAGVLALHIRRGDFETHCDHLATWSAQYNSWNNFPELPDLFEPPPGAGWGKNTPENRAIYKTHCFPTIEEIVKKVMDVKKDHHLRTNRELKRVYIMTNAKSPWLCDLEDALRGADPRGWDLIASSRDLKLSWEQKLVSQDLDMYVGTRAEVFIGNGFSSLTSNVVMLRMAYDVDPLNTRFW